MKVHKVQLCSTTKEGHHTEEWGTDNKDCVEETNISSPEVVDKEEHMFTTAAHETESLAMAVTTQGNTDILLSNVQLVSDIQQPVIWPSDGILRQALLTPEKNIKCEDKPCQSSIESCNGAAPRDFTTVTSSCSTYSSLVTVNVTPQQTLTTTPSTSHVIMMGELESSQIILTGEAMTTTWQNSERKEVTEATCVTSCTVPVVSSRSFNEPTQLAINEHTSEILVNNEGTHFSTLGRISVLNPNVLPPLIETHDKKNEHEVINAFGSSNKKNYTKFNKANKKVQKKTNCHEKRILVKPSSSLLSPVALNYRVVDSKNTVLNVVTSAGSVVANGELLGSVLSDLERPSTPVQIVPNMEYTIKGSPKISVKMVDSQLPVSSPSVIIASESNNFGAVPSVSAHQNLNVDHLTVSAKNSYQQCLNENTEDSNMLNYSNHNIINHTGTEASSVLTSNSSPSSTTTVTTSMQNQVRILNLNSPTLIQDSILASSVNRMLTADGQPPLNQRMLTTEDQDLINNSGHHTSSLMVGDEFHQQSTEVILSPDMEPHGNEIQTTQNDGTYTTQGYTAHILSQLSNASTLPAISSSQVSSVLSALEPNKPASSMNSIDNLSCKSRKTTIKNENVSTEFVKTENSGDSSSIKKKKRATDQKWKICEMNKYCCYRCCSCMFISLRSDTVDEHFAQEHEVVRSDFVNKQLTKRQIKCIGCDNIFFSKHALQVHLLQDHSVFGSELPGLLNVVMTANKVIREYKHTTVVNEGVPATVTDVATTPVSVHSSSTTTASLQPAVSKHVPSFSTPLFCLFDNVSNFANKDNPQLAAVKKDTENVTTKEESENVKKKRQPQSSQNYRRIKSKLKVDDIKLEIKDTIQKCSLNGCTVRLQVQSNMDYHRKCHSGNSSESEAFTCPECSHKSPHWSSLTMHLWKLHNIDMELFSCDKCNYKTNSHSKLMNLHRRIHGDERPFLCDLCGKGFKTTKQLRNHKAMHKKNRAKGKNEDGTSQQNFPCVLCGRTFIDRRVLRLHTENVHNKLKLFVCSFCEHAASSRSSLRMHIRQHTGEKPFSCEECEYTTSDHNSLRRHKMRHSGTKPYRCPHCAYACIQSSTYKVHLKTKHPGLCEGLMYSCSLCSFHTVKKDNFLTHSADHALGVDPLRGRRKTLNLVPAQETPSSGNINNSTTTIDKNKNSIIVSVDPGETLYLNRIKVEALAHK